MRVRAEVLLGIALLAACGAELPPPRERSVSEAPPIAAPAPGPPPNLSLVIEESLGVPLAPRADAPAPLDRTFERVPLPADALEAVAVGGHSESDVWIVGFRETEAIALYHWDGARVKTDKGPACGVWRLEPWGMRLAPDAVTILGSYFVGEGEGRFEARRSSRGTWECGELELHPEALTRGPVTLNIHGYDDPRLPMPGNLRRAGWSDAEIDASSPTDIWLYQPGAADLLHGNGVAWESRPTRLASVRSLRVDATGAAWLVGATDRKNDEGDAVLFWDRPAHAFRRLPTPPDFHASRVRIASERDVWFIGKEHVHRWDGRTLHRAPTPVPHVRGAWVSARGELWIVGSDRMSDDRNARPHGLAMRARVPEGGTP
jgi:hypothetical protein